MLIRRSAHPLNAWSLVRLIVETVAGTYIAVLSTLSIVNKSVLFHGSITKHICAVGGASVLHWYLMTFGRYLDIHNLSVIHWTEYAILGLTSGIVALSGLIPLGPELHQDMMKVYSKAVTARLIELGYNAEDAVEPNVN